MGLPIKFTEAELIEIGKTETTKNGKEIRKCKILIEDEKGYEDVFELTFMGDKVDYLDGKIIGEMYRFTCSLSGREWTNKEGKSIVFHSIMCWGIKLASEPESEDRGSSKRSSRSKRKGRGGAGTQTENSTAVVISDNNDDNSVPKETEEDDLPF